MTTPRRHDTTGPQDDAIAALLHGVDAAPLPPVQPGLAERVRTRARRQQRRRRAAIGSALTVTVVAGTLAVVGPLRSRNEPIGREVNVATVETRPAEVSDPVRLAAEMKDASVEAEVRLAVARRLTAMERRGAKYARLDRALALAAAQPVQFDPVAAQRDQAALTMVDHADRLQNRAGRPGDALAAYRRAVELFPDTPSAEVARRRIEQLQSQNKT